MDELFGQLDLLKKPVPKKKSNVGINMRSKGAVEVNVSIVDRSDGDIDRTALLAKVNAECGSKNTQTSRSDLLWYPNLQPTNWPIL